MKRFLPWIILAVAAVSIAANWLPPKTAKDDFDFGRFGEIPVLVGGRVKPFDTVARNSLLIIHGKQELRLESGKRLSAMQWLTDVLFNAPVADRYPVFVVQNADVLGLFGWQQSDRKYFSFAEFTPFLRQIDEQGAQSDKLEAVQRSAYQSAILNLRNALALYQRVKNSIQPEEAQDFSVEVRQFESNLPGAARAARARENGENVDKSKLNDVAERLKRGGCVVMLDGLDEVGDPAKRRKVASWTEKQMLSYPNNKFIISSRPYGYAENQVHGVTVLEIAPFSLRQVQKFIGNWYLANEVQGSQKDDEGVRIRARGPATPAERQLESTEAQLAALAESMQKNRYGQYLLQLLDEEKR